MVITILEWLTALLEYFNLNMLPQKNPCNWMLYNLEEFGFTYKQIFINPAKIKWLNIVGLLCGK